MSVGKSTKGTKRNSRVRSGLKTRVARIMKIRNLQIGLPEIGVFQNSPSGRESLFVYVMWDGAPEISACVSLEFSKKSDRNDAYKRLLRNPACSIETSDDSGHLTLWSRKQQNDPSAWAETLDALLNEWLACWPAARRLK